MAKTKSAAYGTDTADNNANTTTQTSTADELNAEDNSTNTEADGKSADGGGIATDAQTDEPMVENPTNAEVAKQAAGDDAEGDGKEDGAQSVDGEHQHTEPSDPGKPGTNVEGFRNRFINGRDQITVMDDETAAMFYHNPHFYAFTYDDGRKLSVHVSTLEWCTENGDRTGQRVGEPYSLGT